MRTKLISSALVFGGCGGFGVAFTEQLTASGISVITVDREGEPDILVQDVEPSALAEALAKVDLVLLCMPQAASVSVLQGLDGRFEEGLVVDICSVKSEIAKVAESVCLESEYVSFHPMFGPDRGFKDSNGVVIPIRGGQRAEEFKSLLIEWHVRVIDTDVATHDRVTSLVQVVTHAVLASFANLRANIREAGDIPEDIVDAFATPVFAELERVSQGMVRENPELYHNIQTANPWGDETRAMLTQAVSETLSILSEPDAEGVRSLFSRVRNQSN
ncbi:MAG: prephenate dehydrogenase/arogenate dehydrogenase family protein [Pseudomonadales bacterium]|nr:prephenate dehydrogenase/arogenate dehydrogenase family protein [Pseudomonadales bacterium]